MNIEIANRLVQLRKKNGFSQEELAARLGISRQAVSKWERAESSPDTDNLILLAQLYHVSLDDLLRTDDPVTPKPPSWDSTSAQSGPQAPGPGAFNPQPQGHPACSEAAQQPPYLQTFLSAAPVLSALLLQLLFTLIPPLHSLAAPIFTLGTTCIYLILGCCFRCWHPGWLVFFDDPGLHGGHRRCLSDFYHDYLSADGFSF
ncbi:MAG: helix-turn-helix transcriptional regulator [Oscillospiraceae bacterium]|nr:helix-turn-helix transcriptional regulator [Oscillospiraceae bacterium]